MPYTPLGDCKCIVVVMNSHKKKNPSSDRKMNVCTKCGRPSRGHVGPQGKNCGMDATPTKPAKVEQPNFDEQSENSETGRDAVLLELSSQLGKLSIGMEKMQSDLA